MVSRKEGGKEDTFFPSCGVGESLFLSPPPSSGDGEGGERDGARPSLNGLESRPERGKKNASSLPVPLFSLATHAMLTTQRLYVLLREERKRNNPARKRMCKVFPPSPAFLFFLFSFLFILPSSN